MHLKITTFRVAGVPCEIITGYSKSAVYQLSRPLDKRKTSCQWNAVYVNSDWHLVDCLWSSTSVIGSEDETQWDLLDVGGKLVQEKQITGK